MSGRIRTEKMFPKFYAPSQRILGMWMWGRRERQLREHLTLRDNATIYLRNDGPRSFDHMMFTHTMID